MDGGCSVAVDGLRCTSPVLARGYCVRHYRRFRRWGDPLGGGSDREVAPDDGLCSVSDCDEPYRSKGLCNRHYKQARYVPRSRY